MCLDRSVHHVCRLFSNLVDVSKLEGKRDFMLFEDGIEPDWDDPGNEKGGLWLAHSSDMSLNTAAEDGSVVTLHTVWLDTVCCHPLTPPLSASGPHLAGAVLQHMPLSSCMQTLFSMQACEA